MWIHFPKMSNFLCTSKGERFPGSNPRTGRDFQICCLHIKSIEFLLHYNAVDLFFSVSQHLTKDEKSFEGIFFPFQKEIQFGTKWELFINQNMPINTVKRNVHMY